MNKNKEKVPKIRFPGFTEPWEQRKLGEVAVRVTRKNKDLESTLPLTISAQDGLIDQNEFFNKTVASRDVSGYYLVKNGEFAYNKSYSNGYPWGAVKRLDRYEMGVLSTLYIVFKPTNIDSDFLTKYYDGDNWHKEVSKHAAEGARNHGLLNIAASDFFETKLTIPLSKKEQEQIGLFFNNMDNLITLHQRKLDHLKDKKKGLLQKMFPKKGELVPELRFPEFTDPWEQRKFDEIFTMLQNNVLSRADLNSEQGSAMNVHYGDILIKFGECLDVSKEKIPFITDDTCLTKYKESFLVNGDVIIADAAEDEAVGKCSEIVGLTTETVISGLHTIPCRANKVFANGYLGYYMNSNAYHNQLLPLIQGTKVSSISKTALKDTIVLYPKSTEEQALISQYFTKLNNLITLHQRKLDHLKEQKKALLQQMFI